MSEKLPALMDCAMIRDELGVSRKAAEKIMRDLPRQNVPGLRKMYVRRADVEEYLERNRQAA